MKAPVYRYIPRKGIREVPEDEILGSDFVTVDDFKLRAAEEESETVNKLIDDIKGYNIVAQSYKERIEQLRLELNNAHKTNLYYKKRFWGDKCDFQYKRAEMKDTRVTLLFSLLVATWVTIIYAYF